MNLLENDQLPIIEEQSVKRPLNSYILYCSKNRSKLQEQNPFLSNKEITKILGNNWKNLSPEEREPYVQEANALLTVFKSSNPEYHYTKSTKKRLLQGERSTALYESISNSANQLIQMTEPPTDPSEFLAWIGAHIFTQYIQSNEAIPDKLVSVLLNGNLMVPPTQEDIQTIIQKLKKEQKRNKSKT